MKSFLSLTLFAAVAEGRKFLLQSQTSAKAELCGKGFDSLNQGSQDYFNTISEHLWTHPGNQDAFGVFQDDMQCWFAKMLGSNCGGLAAQPDRKKELYAACNDPTKVWSDIDNHLTQEEFVWFRKSFPKNEDGDVYSQAMTAMHDINKKELLCTTMFVIDDGCVDFKYVNPK